MRSDDVAWAARAGCSACALDGAAHCTPASPTNYEVRDQPLDVTLVASDGGSFSSEYSSQNVLVDDRSVYCTLASEGVNLIARCSSGSSSSGRRPGYPTDPASDASTFLLTSIVVKVPATGFTSPMGQAVVFTSWEYPDLEAIKHFDAACSQQDFERLTASYSSNTASARATSTTDKDLPPADLFQMAVDNHSGRRSAEAVSTALSEPPHADWLHADWLTMSPPRAVAAAPPAASNPRKEANDASRPVPRLFIDMGQSHEGRFLLPSPVSGRFVVIKMLRAKHSHADNIDVQFLGLRGYTSPPCFGTGMLV